MSCWPRPWLHMRKSDSSGTCMRTDDGSCSNMLNTIDQPMHMLHEAWSCTYMLNQANQSLYLSGKIRGSAFVGEWKWACETTHTAAENSVVFVVCLKWNGWVAIGHQTEGTKVFDVVIKLFKQFIFNILQLSWCTLESEALTSSVTVKYI